MQAARGDGTADATSRLTLVLWTDAFAWRWGCGFGSTSYRNCPCASLLMLSTVSAVLGLTKLTRLVMPVELLPETSPFCSYSWKDPTSQTAHQIQDGVDLTGTRGIHGCSRRTLKGDDTASLEPSPNICSHRCRGRHHRHWCMVRRRLEVQTGVQASKTASQTFC